MRNSIITILAAVVLAGCSSIPKPPTVGGSRTFINDKETAGVLALRAEMAYDRQKIAELKAELTKIQYQLESIESNERSMNDPRIVRIHFPFGSAKFKPSLQQQAQLNRLLKTDVRRIELRGRTDGKRPTKGDEKIALKRALSAQDYLVNHGVSPSSISINYLSSGDYIADNHTKAGRALNRRVEVEFIQ